MIVIKNLTIRFLENEKPVLKNIDVTFKDQGLIIIKGPSGSGKSTFLKAIRGDIDNFDGTIIVNDFSLNSLDDIEKQKYQLFTTGVVYQDNSLINELTIKENLLLMGDNVKEKIEEYYYKNILKKVGLGLDLDTPVRNLSGGERQRLCIARAIFFNPSILLLDEPTSSLDKLSRDNLLKVLLNLAKEKLVIIVTHEDNIIDNYGDELYEINDGILKNIRKNVIPIREASSSTFTLKRPYKMLVSYLFKRMINKRRRTMFLSIFLAFGLFVGGISEVMVNSVSDEVQISLQGYADPNTFMLTTINEAKEERESLSEATLKEIWNEIPSVFGIGTYYENDFKQLFPTINECRLVTSSTYPIISSFNLNSINEFRYINLKSETIYPLIDSLQNDELVLGLPQSLMKSFCNLLKIENPNYYNLGEYIAENSLKIVFYGKNASWDYENEEIFIVKAIKPSDIPLICHTNLQFNEYFFMTRMHLKETYSWYEEVDYPWTLRKRSVIYSKDDIIDDVEIDSRFHKYLFDEFLITENYYSYFASVSNTQYVNSNELSQICFANKGINGYLKGSEEGYQIIDGTILHGFKGYFCLSNNAEALYQSENIISVNNQNLDFGNDVFFNSILNQNHLNNLSVKPYQDKFAISSILAQSLNFHVGQIAYILYYDIDSNKFFHDEWVIEDIISSEFNTIYVGNKFLDNFFRLTLGVKSSLLKAKTILFQVEDGVDLSLLINLCNQNYQNYYFSSPSKTLLDGVNESLKGLNIGLTIFSIWILVFASLLIKVAQDLYIWELKDDISLMVKLGLGNKIPKEIRFFTRFILWILALCLSILFFVTFYLFSLTPILNEYLPFKISLNGIFFIKIILFSGVLFLFSLPKRKQYLAINQKKLK